MIFYPLEKISNLHNNYRKTFEVNGLPIMLIQHQDELFLLESFCPHAGFPMVDSKIIGSNLRCQMHGYLFDLASGACNAAYEGPCRDMKTYELIYQDDTVGVNL